MSKINSTIAPKEKVTIRLHAGDKERLAHYYPGGYNHAIREIVHTILRKLDDRQAIETSPSTLDIKETPNDLT